MPDGLRIFGAAHRYVQGPDAISSLGGFVRQHGARAAVVIDAFIAPKVLPRIRASLDKAGAEAAVIETAEEVRREYFEPLARQVAASGPVGCVVAVGGGKAIDNGKGVAHTLGVPVLTVPTIASNDSPASKAIAVYNDRQLLIEVIQMEANPAVVIVDTSVLVAAPTRYLAAGIGDAVAKKYEVDGCMRSGGITPQGTLPLATAYFIAAGAEAVLRRDALAAIRDAREGVLSEAFENTVEAVILMAALGFENGGLSVAHAMTRGLMTARGASRALHGEHVAYGLLVQLELDRAVSEAHREEMTAFLAELGLPISLAELGLTEPTEEEFSSVATGCLSAKHAQHIKGGLSTTQVLGAMSRVEHRYARRQNATS